MIHINNLTLTTNTKILLNNFSAQIKQGERIGIFGPNGAGKSTFLRGLLGLFPKKSGNILFNGKSFASLSHEIAYLPQDWDTMPADYTVWDFLKLSMQGKGFGFPWTSQKNKAAAENALNEVNALHLRAQRFKSLSGGERKRILLAALLLNKPKILMLDEPLANLDPRYQSETLALIQKLQQKHQWTLFITAHDFNPLLPMLDKVMFIGEGQAILDYPEKVIQGSVLSELYKTPLQVVNWQNRRWVLSQDEQAVFLHPGEHCHGVHCVDEHIQTRVGANNV